MIFKVYGDDGDIEIAYSPIENTVGVIAINDDTEQEIVFKIPKMEFLCIANIINKLEDDKKRAK